MFPIGNKMHLYRGNDLNIPVREYYGLTSAYLHEIFPFGNMKTIENTEQLGSLIRAERKRLKVTQKELAMAAGTGLRFIIELERGKETTRIGNIFKVLQALGIKVMVDSPGNYPDRTRAP